MTAFVGLHGYAGIKSQEVLNMYVSDAQTMEVGVLIGIRIADSEPIEIRVGVGDHPKRWHIPKQLLMNSSTFFAAAVDGGFAEQYSKTVTLPEVATNDFEVWVQWLYVGEVRPKEIGRRNLDHDKGPYHKELARLWLLGDMLGCTKFQSVLLTVLGVEMNYKNHGMRPEFLAFIWDTCAHGSKLREFVVNQLNNDFRMGRFEGDLESIEAYTHFAEDNEDFAREYTAASMRNSGLEWLPQSSCRKRGPLVSSAIHT